MTAQTQLTIQSVYGSNTALNRIEGQVQTECMHKNNNNPMAMGSIGHRICKRVTPEKHQIVELLCVLSDAYKK